MRTREFREGETTRSTPEAGASREESPTSVRGRKDRYPTYGTDSFRSDCQFSRCAILPCWTVPALASLSSDVTDETENTASGLATPLIRREIKTYCEAHPNGPSATAHPRIMLDHGRYVALLGRSISRGMLGFGTSVRSALRAFDELYPSYLRSQGR